MRKLLWRISKLSEILWRGLRAWSGDSAYENYLRSRAVRAAGCPPLSRKEFYVQQLNRRYSRPNRCC
ncbi:MAG TPA: YbdD/YjiX family protein [Terriglobales bacterium]|nr:YbdD/YjiX family protein [Terriglobales bacterium]